MPAEGQRTNDGEKAIGWSVVRLLSCKGVICGKHEGKPFYEPLVAYITSGPVAVMILEGKDAIQVARRTMGATNPAQADPGTIRADFSIEVGRNLVHGSDGPETATFEVALFFSEDEIVSWKRDLDPWILE
jgi:nucleoside-diphosphate kinase